MKIAQRITGLFLLVSLVPLVGATLLAYQSSRELLAGEMASRLQVAVDNQAQRITAILVNQNQFGHGLVNQYELGRALISFLTSQTEVDRTHLARLIIDAGEARKDIRSIVVMDSNGDTLMDVVFDAAEGTPSEVPESMYHAYSPLLATSLIPVLFEHDVEPRARVFVSGAVKDGATVLGYIGTVFAAEEIVAVVSDYAGLGSSGETGLVQSVDGADAQYVTSLRFDDEAAFSRIAKTGGHDTPALASLNKVPTIVRASDYREVGVVAAVRYIDVAGLGVYVKMDESEVFAPLRRLAWNFIGLILFGSVAAIFAAVYFSKFLTDPIAALTRAASRIQAGNLEEKTGIQSRDEIGTLAATIDQMAESLLKRNQELLEDIRQRELAEEKLLKRTDELERLNKVMLDREMRVVELKKKLEGQDKPEQIP